MTINLNRRTLIAGSLLGAGSLALPRLAFAQGAGTRNLLFVLLRGAADGLSMLAPVGDPGFERLRGAMLGDYESAPRLGSFFAVHPALAEIAKSAQAGEALFVHAAATAYRERSHFDGQNLLETGGTAPYASKDGWLNRLVGMMNEGAPDPLRTLAIAPTVPLALRGNAPVSSYAPSALPDASEDLIARVSQLYAADAELGGLWSRALETRAMAGDDGLRNLNDARATGTLAASLMRGSQGARIGMIELGGWDTHANQRGAFMRQARGLDALIAAYRTGLGDGWADTMVLVATEFGRTARLNGTGGTDHGTAAAALIMGGAVRGGRVIADWPGLAERQLYEGRDLAPTIALENVLAGAVAEHLRIDPARAMSRLFPGRTGAPLAGIVRS
ncbi:hypothetical protein CHX26_12945 [Porphyrobacter sp. HT-58-2]|uniref:DUF1501 domain-containing protein n=1 Tax=Porphyrobacter sp. HT-58-2 TaxID=2023229 RepID=UPI000CDBD208|nr:DUF1501 domain-containing protein [Porphyrobacter sp. HT-58-2]AUX70282.1 hypothetical protein CHX26_12945 [Porphyrobacter sp. HT-58-2]